jgi:hypothetical protein
MLSSGCLVTGGSDRKGGPSVGAAQEASTGTDGKGRRTANGSHRARSSVTTYLEVNTLAV